VGAIVVVAAGIVIAVKASSDDSSTPKAAGNTSVSVPTPTTSPTSSPASSPAASSSAAQATACTQGASSQHDVLAAQLTNALQKHDESAFLALAGDATVKVTMQMWWTNLDAIGFTTGGAQALDEDAPNPASQTYMAIGVHNPFDPNSKTSTTAGAPDIAATDYLLTTTPGTGCLQHISAWKPLSNAPWDMTEKLTVVKTAHTVVAGPAAVASTVRAIAPVAEAAANWDFQFFKANNGTRYLHQTGFVMFVPQTDAQTEGWFDGEAARKPKGWIGDATSVAGFAHPLFGVQLPNRIGLPTDTPTFTDGKNLHGGARVIISRAGLGESPVERQGVLVHEFVHDLLADYDNGYYLGGKGVDAATAEGAARWVESYYDNSPSCYCKNPKTGKYPSALAVLKAGLHPYFSRFKGAVPNDATIYGASSTANYYYDLSASTFDYLATHGTQFGLQSVVDAYINGGGPFDGVFVKYQAGKEYFASPPAQTKKWAAWIRQQMK
jgi:hypothetical protein